MDLPGVGARDVGMSEPEWQDFPAFRNFRIRFADVVRRKQSHRLISTCSRPLLIVARIICAAGREAQMGRAFHPEDHSRSLEEVVISDSLWKRAFGSDPHILDKSARLDTDLYRIVGVMPPGFDAPGERRRKGILRLGRNQFLRHAFALIIRRGTGVFFRGGRPGSNLTIHCTGRKTA